MRKHILILTFLLASLGAFAEDLKVVSAQPKGLFSGGRSALSITFNQPVAALAEQNAFAADNCPIKIVPSIEGVCRFVGTQTLQFEPEQDWAEATQYTAVLPGSFASQINGQKLEKDYLWNFNTARPEVEQVLPSNGEQWIDVRPLIFITFSQPVNLESAQQAVQLSYIEPERGHESWWVRFWNWLKGLFGCKRPAPQSTVVVPLEMRGLTDQEYKENYSYIDREKVLVVQPKKDLPVHSKITLTVSTALRATKGNLGPEQKFTSVFYTYPDLEVAGGNFKGCMPYDAHINFTSPVRLSELLKHVHVTASSALAKVPADDAQTLGYQRFVPKKPQEEDEEVDSDPVTLPAGTGYFVMPLSFLRLTPHQEITLKIDKNLKDIYGQKLGKEQLITLHNEGYCPAVVFKGEKGVLESYLPARHPIDVLNEAQLPVLAARFNKNNFIPFDQKHISYCSQAELKETEIAYQGEYPFDITPDVTKKTYLDLNKFNPTAEDSIVFSQVRVPSRYRQDGYCWVGATDNITDLGVTLKTSQTNTLVWVTSLKEGKPLGQMSVELRDVTNQVLWSGKTDENGLIQAPGLIGLKAQAPNRWSRPVLYAFVYSEGGEAVLASNWNDGLEPWRFNLNFDYNPESEDTKTALFTDRGVYRPGETVYLKGVTRVQKDYQWAFPSAKTAGNITLYNSRGEEVQTQAVTYFPGTGAFDGEFVLPTDATTGTWQVQFTSETGPETWYSFQVEAVKSAEIAVHLQALQNHYFSGEEAKFTASANYLFGAPVAGGKVTWNVRRASEWFHPDGYEGYIFTPYFLMKDEGNQNELLLESNGVLDGQGKVDLTLPLPQVTRLQSIYAEVGVQTPTGQQLFARTSVPLYPASFYMGAYMERWASEVGEKTTARLIAVDVDGKPVGPVKAKARITKEEYLSVRKNGLSGRLEWVSERRSKPIEKRSVTIPEQGVDFSFVPQQPGSYQVVLTAKDAQGREVQGGFDVMVYGKGEAYWKRNDDDLLTLKQEKDSYAPGDTARILVQSPYEQASALVTVERNGILDAWVTEVSSGADSIEVPVKPEYVPNVFVGVTIVRGRAAEPKYDEEGLDLAKPQGKTGYTQLLIPQTDKEIQTQVRTDKAQYQPGEEVTVELQTAVQGNPAAAEVTVMAVDEGVLSLTNYKLPNLLELFYARQPLTVWTADNRVFLIGQRNFGEKGENRGGGGGLLSKLGGVDLRSHFKFTPYFNARVKTDEQGKARVKFTLPDNLTTFRVMAVSATAEEFGAAETTIKVSKPLMITPKMPRFARRGDKFQCGAVVFNYDEASGPITVKASAMEGVQLNAATKKIELAKGASAELSWPCQVFQPGEARVQFIAQGAQSKDAVISNFSVMEVEKTQTLAVYAATQDLQEQILQKPAAVQELAANEVSVSLASTALLNLRGSMLYLLTYPYDCLEQKMSKILPIIEGEQLVKDFNLGSVEEYKKQVQEILQKIPDYQAASGGLAYWPQEQADAYVTAYALQTAYRAKQAGYKVPEEALAKAVQWLKGIFGGQLMQAYPYSAIEESTVRAYGIYVLALYGEQVEGAFNNLYDQYQLLTTPAQAYLLLAAHTLKQSDSVKQSLAQALLNQVQQGAESVHFTSTAEQPWLHMADVNVTALALESFLQSGQKLPQAYQVVRWLIDQLNAKGHWQNTAANAAVFSALHAYYTHYEAEEPDFMASVMLNEEPVLTTTFEGRSVQAEKVSWPFEQVYVSSPQARVQLVKNGTGTLYYTLQQTYTPAAYTDNLNAGFVVKRQITDLQGNPVKQLQAGQRYKVTLKTRTSAAYTFVVLEDFIPAGFEIINTSFATESQAEALALSRQPWGGFNRDEKYDDRIAVFADYLSAGEHEYSYLVQTTVPGTFSYPSAWGSLMYDPAVFGRNASQSITIQP